MIGTALTVGGFTINDRINQPLLHAQPPYFYIMVKNVDGLRQADISYESHPIPNAVGEKSGDVFRRGKTLTLSGMIYAANLSALEQGADYIQQMFASTAIRNLTWTRWADGVPIYLACRVNQDVSVIESFDSDSYRWPWIVGLRADNPFTRRVSDGSVYPTWQT